MTPPPQHQVNSDNGETPRAPGKRPAARGTAFYPRKRANTACQVCRARKTKCDNRKPQCSYCLSVGAKCIQSPVDLSAFDPASLKILERLDELEQLIREPQPQPQPPGDQSPASSGTGPNADAQQTQTQTPTPTHGLGDRLSPLAELSCSPSTSSPCRPPGELEPNDIPLRSILPEKIDSILHWSVLSHQSPQGHLQPTPSESPYVHSYSPGAISLGGLLDVDSQGLKVLLDNFFIHVHCKNPILNEAATRRLVTNTILEGIDWSPNSCLALIICALGKIATPLGPSPEVRPNTAPHLEAQVLFHAAQKRIGTLLTGSDIIGAQCLFLSGVYLMCVFRPFEAWRFFSQALASCQTLPFLQRAQQVVTAVPEASCSPQMAKMRADEEQQEAIYWSAWKSEGELRQQLVLPDFNTSHSTSVLYPPFFPTPPQPPVSVKATDTDRQRTSWLFYLAEISLRRLTSRVCNEILQLHRSSASNLNFLTSLTALIPEYEDQAHQWANSLPSELSMARSPTQDNVCIFVLRGHFALFFETIYWPFVMAQLATLQHGSPMASPGQQYAKRGLEYHIIHTHVNEPGFSHRHHGTWLMIRGSVRSAIVLLAARLLGSEMPVGWHEVVEEIIHLLGIWEDEVPEFSSQRSLLQGILWGVDNSRS